MDPEDNVHWFQAHGLDQFMGILSTVIGEDLMQKLIPNVPGAHKITGANQVDYLIGLGKASWQSLKQPVGVTFESGRTNFEVALVICI